MTSRLRSVAFALAVSLSLGAVAMPADALHVCVTEPCDHGPVDTVVEAHPLLLNLVCKVTHGSWGSNCYGGGSGGDPHY